MVKFNEYEVQIRLLSMRKLGIFETEIPKDGSQLEK